MHAAHIAPAHGTNRTTHRDVINRLKNFVRLNTWQVSELSGQVAAAEAAERVAGAQQREAVERLEGRVHELT